MPPTGRELLSASRRGDAASRPARRHRRHRREARFSVPGDDRLDQDPRLRRGLGRIPSARAGSAHAANSRPNWHSARDNRAPAFEKVGSDLATIHLRRPTVGPRSAIIARQRHDVEVDTHRVSVGAPDSSRIATSLRSSPGVRTPAHKPILESPGVAGVSIFMHRTSGKGGLPTFTDPVAKRLRPTETNLLGFGERHSSSSRPNRFGTYGSGAA